jgi:hypothetical protein
MSEWVSLMPADQASCDASLREALEFVAIGGKAGG